MGKVLKVTNIKANDSILGKTVATAQKRVTKKAKGKANRLKAKQSPKQVERALTRKQKKIEERKQAKDKYHTESGVLLVSHIPHGFFEEQLQKFFSQFGRVTRVRLVRSTISGKSKGYAFIVFRYKEVANIAAETTNNYLMGKRILKAKVIPSAEVKAKWFYHSTPSNQRSTVASKKREKSIRAINKKLAPREVKKRQTAQKRSLDKMVKKLNEVGINYKFKFNAA